MAERFPDFQVEEIQEPKENSENQNTKKSTSTWLNVWTSWAESKNFETNLLSYEAKQLDETLQKFFAEICKKDFFYLFIYLFFLIFFLFIYFFFNIILY